jgi:plasmid stabilization system protein ParE
VLLFVFAAFPFALRWAPLAGQPSGAEFRAWWRRGWRQTGKGAQAFSLIANHCSAAQAECLRRIRESRSYGSLGLTWEQFCDRHLGITRACADRLIQKLDEFGELYFHVSRIAQISAKSYRLVSPAITEQGIEFEGEVIALVPENAARIRQAVKALRAQLRTALGTPPRYPSVVELQIRFDACFKEMAKLAEYRYDAGTRAALVGLIAYSRRHLRNLEASLPALDPAA